MHILIVRLSSIGDIIHTLPAVSCLKEQLDPCRITWVCEAPGAQLLQACPDVDRVITVNRRSLNPRIAGAAALRELRALFSELRDSTYDLVLDFQGLFKSALICRTVHGRRIIGFASGREASRFLYSETAPAQDFTSHAIKRHLGLVRYLGCRPTAPVFKLLYDSTDAQHVRGLLERFGDGSSVPVVCVHPGSRWPTKCWPARSVSELCRRRPRADEHIVLLTGDDSEYRRNEEIRAHAGPGVYNTAGQLSLPQLAALFARAHLVVAMDSGPMHLACAVGAPVLALMGPTAPWRTGPFGARARCLFLGLACSPCFQRRTCPLGHQRCMHAISVDSVREAWAAVLRKPR